MGRNDGLFVRSSTVAIGADVIGFSSGLLNCLKSIWPLGSRWRGADERGEWPLLLLRCTGSGRLACAGFFGRCETAVVTTDMDESFLDRTHAPLLAGVLYALLLIEVLDAPLDLRLATELAIFGLPGLSLACWLPGRAGLSFDLTLDR